MPRNTKPSNTVRKKLIVDLRKWAIVTVIELAVNTPIFASRTSKLPVVSSKPVGGVVAQRLSNHKAKYDDICLRNLAGDLTEGTE